MTEVLVALDTETGGLDPLRHSVLSVALSGLGSSIEVLVCEPEIVATREALAINRIDLDHLRVNGMRPGDACAALSEFLDRMSEEGKVKIVGHNVAFDIAFVRRLYELADRTPPKALLHRTVDTASLLWALSSVGIIPDTATSSSGAFEHFDVAPSAEDRHTAMGDAVATLRLVEKIRACLAAAVAQGRGGVG